ncbi:alpha-L-arabinofuranosidase C-terminal domain-containing protein [Zhihengliuella halotolerans]|uniref:non-reducing end alpha-L-arabinofuranosidase n=1 Tax=Zhihengliuella halotolerans TaxID=370736 RepID=A0A4Q8ABH2_9MICC|nr:alpha-L-arabinofuranosidase C-terminal domain-containing protein [Zhihengliuella halotolerans]RZU60883.1 alpha-L-arabinofuranosidase [Zhihengliuella halotolerans]
MYRRKHWAAPLALTLALALPATAFAAPPPAPAPAAPAPSAVDVNDADYDAYVFPYFTGEGNDDGEKIHLAVSDGDDPMAWHDLNGGEPVLESTLGTQGLRDPFLIRSADGAKYFLIATDLKMYGGGSFGDAQETGSRSLMVWESTNLIDWSEQREVTVAPEHAGNVWAPEAHWDEANGEYIVYWASALYPDDVAPGDRDINTSYQRMMYSTTTDFVEFSEPRVWIDEKRGDGRGMIDSTIAEVGDTFYRLTKDESDMTVRQESSDDLRLTQGVAEGDGWDLIAEQIGVGQPNPWGGTFTSGEGPTMFPSLTDDGWYLMIDQPSYHGGQGYMLFETEDLNSGDWTSVPDADLPTSPRHGTVVPITGEEQSALLDAFPPAEEPGDVVPGPDPELGEGTWRDDFDAAELDSAWEIVNEDAEAWNLGDSALNLTSQTGDTWQDDNAAENLFMVDVPAGDFSVATKVTAPVSKDFQGAGIIAWKDIDNYVRSGLSHVSFGDGGPVVIESGLEENAAYNSTLTPRPGSTTEWLRLDRTGDEIVVSYGDENGDWAEAERFTTSWDVTQVGIYALAAQDGSSHEAAFDTFWLDTSAPVDVVPEGVFTLTGAADARYLAADGDGSLSLTGERPLTTLRLAAEETGTGGVDGERPVTLTAKEQPVSVHEDGRLFLGEAGSDNDQWRLTDAGAGRVHLRLAGAEDDAAYATRSDDGALVLGAAASAAAFSIGSGAAGAHTVSIDGDGTAHEISDTMYGAFYEDINYAADGGIYAELVRNRSFEFAPSDNASFNGLTGWEVVGDGDVSVASERDEWLNDSNRAYVEIAADSAGDGVRNTSYNEGVALIAGESYDFSVWARSAVAQDLTVSLEDPAGEQIHATATVAVDGSDEWKQYTATLTSENTTDAGRLSVTSGAAGTLRLDMVSLFPQDTWEGPVNGPSVLRKDLAQMVADLDPSFLRFPGGCVTNVGTFDTYLESDGQDRQRTYQWKETIGPVEERPTNWNFWGYNQTYGLGYLEYMKWAEDLGATPLPVVSVGANGCGSTIPEMTDDVRIDRWVQDTLDLIEFANGDVDTEWGGARADLGHPEPFNLEYIGLGNEENTKTFEANFPRFRDAIEAKYPEITIISNTGPDDSGTRFDELWDFNVAEGVEMVDEHYYNDPAWFLANDDRYDSYDREGPHVFLGEYASRGNTFANALAEAAYMTGLERNSDVVEMASYAPMFANEDHVQWAPDMMWFDNDESWGSVNYYNQKLWMTNVGDEVVPSTHEAAPVEQEDLSGGVFLSSWLTQAAYDDVTVTDNGTGDVLFSDSFEDASQWEAVAGQWSVADGEYVQSDATVEDARTIITDAYNRDWEDYTLELTARKDGGDEGFLVGFAAGASDDFYWWNLGGWGNTRSVLERADGARQGEVAAKEGVTLESGRDYQVKIVVEGDTIELYLDGELHLSYSEPTPKSLYQVVTRDTETQELIVKVVNPTGTAAETTFDISDVELGGTAAVTELVGDPAAANTKGEKTAVAPREFELAGVADGFTYEVPAHSVTFLRIGTQENEPVEERLATETTAKDAKAKVGKDAKFTVRVAAPEGEDQLDGDVLVRVDGVETTSNLKNGKAKVGVPTDGLAPGEHDVEVGYAGNDQFAPSSTTVTLTVR